MKHRTKFSPQEQQQEQIIKQQNTQQTPVEFDTVEEMLRFDAKQTPTPPGVAMRLHESLGHVPPVRCSWWRRLFGK